MSSITTHVLDTAKGCPATGIEVSLEYFDQTNNWQTITSGVTDTDGRITDWLQQPVDSGTYRITFDTDTYHHGEGFFPTVVIVFKINANDSHYHVPLLLSPFSFSTYRGS